LPEASPSDEALMQATAGGDLNAFDQLVVRHQSAAWGVAYRSLGDADEAEDMVQEAFLRILDAADRYKPTAAFRTYLYRVLTRLCIDHTRKKRPLPTDKLPDVPDPGLTPAERIEREEMESAIQMALDTLSPRYRMAIILRYFEGLNGAEIAEAMKTTPKAVERLLARARKSLKPLLAPHREP
jgi:RNA polymerase sigma-70 factor, ECF subfamily